MGCYTFIKCMMLLFNLLIFLGGLTLLAVGIWVTVDGGSFVQVLGPFSGQAMHFVNVGFVCIAVGAALLLMGLLGSCGAHKGSKCLLLLFFSIVLVIFVAEVAAAVVALAYSSVAEGLLKAWATPALKDQYGTDPTVTKIWNTTMTEMDCCGFTDYADFTNSSYLEMSSGHYPPTCCSPDSALNCTQDEAMHSAVKGCFEQLLDILIDNATIVGGIAAGIGLVEIAAMVVSMYLYCHLDKNGTPA